MLVLFIWFIVIFQALVLNFPLSMTLKGGLYADIGEFDVAIYLYSIKCVSYKKRITDLKMKEKRKDLEFNANCIKKSIECIGSIVSVVNIGFWSMDIEPHQVSLMNSFCRLFPYGVVYFGKGEERVNYDICLTFSIFQIIIDIIAILKAQKEGK